MAFTTVAAVAEIPPGTGKQLTVHGRTIALFNVNGTYFAIDDTCTHRGASLAEGECEGAEVICPWHGARFDLLTGSALSSPARTGVQVYPVQGVGKEVRVEVP